MGVVNFKIRITNGFRFGWYDDRVGDILTVNFEEIMSSGKKIYRTDGEGSRGIFADDCIVLAQLNQYPTLSKHYIEAQ